MHSYLRFFHRVRGRRARLGRAAAASFPSAIFFHLTLALLSAAPLAAQQHLVSPDELQEHIRIASDARQSDLRDVREFFSSEAVSERLPAAIGAARIEEILPFLDEAELARLAETTRAAERDLKAGALTNQQLTYIVIALATAVVVILLT